MIHLNLIKRTNLILKKEDWCLFKGVCKENNDNHSNLCYFCKYRKSLDIPKMLELKNKNKN